MKLRYSYNSHICLGTLAEVSTLEGRLQESS